MSGIYRTFKEYVADNTIDLDTHTFKVALMDNTHTFTSTNSLWANVSGNEISGTGYTAGGKTLASVTWASTGGDTIQWDAADSSWTSATFTAYHAVIYGSTSNALVCSFNFGGAQTVSNGTFTIQWNANGILRCSG